MKQTPSQEMWSALTSMLSKDLSEFAAVVSQDTKSIVDAVVAPDSPTTPQQQRDPTASPPRNDIIAGDELCSESQRHYVSDEALLIMQKQVRTFTDPITADEKEACQTAATRWGQQGVFGWSEEPEDDGQQVNKGVERGGGPLSVWEALRLSNPLVQFQYEVLVQGNGQLLEPRSPAEAPPRSASRAAGTQFANDGGGADASSDEDRLAAQRHLGIIAREDFFRRYFARLAILRHRSQPAPPSMNHNDAPASPAGGGAMLWGDDLSITATAANDLAPSPVVAAAPSSVRRRVAKETVDEDRSHPDADVEGLVASLGQQVTDLKAENQALKASLAETRQTIAELAERCAALTSANNTTTKHSSMSVGAMPGVTSPWPRLSGTGDDRHTEGSPAVSGPPLGTQGDTPPAARGQQQPPAAKRSGLDAALDEWAEIA